MSRLLRGIIAAAVVLLVIAGFWQWREYSAKKELRDNALLYFKEQDYSKTIQYLEEALNRHSLLAGSLDHDMTCYLAESYYQLADYEKAEEIYDSLIAADPGESRYYQLKGRCAREAGDYERAMEIYKQGWEKTEDSLFLKDICDIYLEIMKMPFPLRSRELLPEEKTRESSCIRRLLSMNVLRIMRRLMRRCRNIADCFLTMRMRRKK